MAQHAKRKRHQSHEAHVLARRWLTRGAYFRLSPLFQARTRRNTWMWIAAIAGAFVVAELLTGFTVGQVGMFIALYIIVAMLLAAATFARMRRWLSLETMLSIFRGLPTKGGVPDALGHSAALLIAAVAVVARAVARRSCTVIGGVLHARLHGFVHTSLSTRLSTVAARVFANASTCAACARN